LSELGGVFAVVPWDWCDVSGFFAVVFMDLDCLGDARVGLRAQFVRWCEFLIAAICHLQGWEVEDDFGVCLWLDGCIGMVVYLAALLHYYCQVVFGWGVERDAADEGEQLALFAVFWVVAELHAVALLLDIAERSHGWARCAKLACVLDFLVQGGFGWLLRLFVEVYYLAFALDCSV